MSAFQNPLVLLTKICYYGRFLFANIENNSLSRWTSLHMWTLLRPSPSGASKPWSCPTVLFFNLAGDDKVSRRASVLPLQWLLSQSRLSRLCPISARPTSRSPIISSICGKMKHAIHGVWCNWMLAVWVVVLQSFISSLCDTWIHLLRDLS